MKDPVADLVTNGEPLQAGGGLEVLESCLVEDDQAVLRF